MMSRDQLEDDKNGHSSLANIRLQSCHLESNCLLGIKSLLVSKIKSSLHVDHPGNLCQLDIKDNRSEDCHNHSRYNHSRKLLLDR